MTEGNVEVIVLNNQKPKTPLNDENNKDQNQKEIQVETNSNKISIENINSEISNSEERVNQNQNQNYQNPYPQLEFNQTDIIELPKEIKIKLNIPPCSICQSDNYSLFIPYSSFSPENPEKSKDQPAEPQKNINVETDTIKNIQKQDIFFPILICQQNHQICLICRQNPHINILCAEQFLNYNYIIAVYDIIKENIPKEKKNDFNLLYNFCLSKVNHNKSCCCNWKCVWAISLLIFLFILWTVASAVLLVIGIAILALSLAFRVLCCCYHFWYSACCTKVSETEEDKGSYILRTIHYDGAKIRANEMEAKDDDKKCSLFGAGGLTCAIIFIPKGYKKILDWYYDWSS